MTKAENSDSTKVSSADFKFGKEIGHGSFSTVMLAKDLRTQTQCAAKVIDKAFIMKQKMRSTVMIERESLRRIKHPFFIYLICTFQDTSRLYFIMSYAECGEILSHLNRLSCFDLQCTRFYAAELIVALEYLHNLNIVHRDLKPENILLSTDMHIKLCDFGSALILDRSDLDTPTFTGTPQFVSPEMLGFGRQSSSRESLTDGQSPSGSDIEQPPPPPPSITSAEKTEIAYMMDFWALGCIVYQLLSGRMPFHVRQGRHEYEIFQKIRRLEYEFPSCFDADARDFVEKLLVLSPLERLGNPSQQKHEALKRHILFQGTDFDGIGQCKPPLLLPNIAAVVQDDWDEIPPGFEAAWRFNIKKEFQEFEKADKAQLLQTQERQNPFHRFVRGRLITKQGILYKRRGLFSHKRMFLLTEGPHLLYVDPDSMTLKKEVDLGAVTSLELRSDKVFYIVTRRRTYFLEDPSAKAEEWCQSVEAICTEHYPSAWAGKRHTGAILPPVASSTSSAEA